MRHRLITLSAVLLGVAGCPSDSTPTAPATAGKPAPSLVLVTLDTTRADRIGAYGYQLAHTPNIDELAQGGLRFARAYGVVPLTTPTHSSILTGLYPTRHGVRTNGDAILPDQAVTLAEVLGEHGYQTAATVSAFVTTRIWNLDQGFDTYFDSVRSAEGRESNRWMRERPADEVVDDAVSWLTDPARGEGPFFLWAHFYDPHRPYDAPREWAERLPQRPYDAEVAFMDEQLGRLVAAAEAAGGEGGVAWIAVADHGEALRGEHGESDHGMFLFDPTMRVPFVVQPAEPLASPKVVDDVAVSNVDVMPTALGMLGIAPPPGLDGVDLSPLLRDEKVDRAPVYLESYTVQQRFGYHPELAVAQHDMKLIATPSPRLYDLRADPDEQANLVAERAPDVERLRQVLQAFEAESVLGQGDAVAPEVSEQLAALGYMAVGAVEPHQRSDIDAKDRLETIRSIENARRLGQAPDKTDEAIAAYVAVIEKEPQIVEARLGLSRLYLKKKDVAAAEKVLRDALALDETSAVLRMNLINALSMEGRFAEALAEAEHLLTLVPTDSGARTAVMRNLAMTGRPDEALKRAAEWEAEGPLEPSLQAEVGLLLAQAGDIQGARARLLESLKDDVPRPFVCTVLAREAAMRGGKEEAMEWLRRELDHFPEQQEARWVLANYQMEQSRWDDAAAEYHYLAEAYPAVPDYRRAWAQATFNTGDYEQAAAILEPAVEAAPDDPDILLLQANVLKKQGHDEQAQAVYEQARAIKQDKKPRPPSAVDDFDWPGSAP